MFTHKEKKFAKEIPLEDAVAIRQRLVMIDASQLQGRMGPFATYVDTQVELRVHFLAQKGPLDLTIINPLESRTRRYKFRPLPDMPEAVKEVFCEVSHLRNRLTTQPVDEICEPATSTGH